MQKRSEKWCMIKSVKKKKKQLAFGVVMSEYIDLGHWIYLLF
jgi:hypothetical protein